MKHIGYLSFVLLSMFVLTDAGAATVRPGKCTRVSEGIRGDYSTNKVYLCQVDMNRLMVIDRQGYKEIAPAGVYKITPDHGTKSSIKNVVVGGFILK